MPTDEPSGSNPYKGPLPFDTGDTLYGRDREVRELLSQLLADRSVLLYAVSGAGKTSLLRAGLVPGLAWKGFDALPVVEVGAEQPEGARGNRYLLSAMQSLEKGWPKEDRWPPERLAPLTFADYLRDRAPPLPSDSEGGVLLFDQFEEALTLDPTDHEEKKHFFRQLGHGLRAPAGRQRGWWAVLSMREEFIAALEPYLPLLPNRIASRFRLELLKEKAAKEAIREPARAAGVTFDKRAADRLFEDLCRTRVQRLDGKVVPTKGRYAEPVYLQVVCHRLWDKRADPTEISLADVETLGNVDQALEAYYEEQVRKAAKAAEIPEREVREWVQTHLINEQDVRGQVPRGPQKSRELDNRAVEQLVRGYVLRAEVRHGVTWYELAHDRLIEPVKVNNDNWLRENLKVFQRQAKLWADSGRTQGLLAEGEVLAEGEELAAANQLNAHEREYLAASRAERDRREDERQKNLKDFQLMARLWTRRGRPPELLAEGGVLDEGEELATAGRLNAREREYLVASRAERGRRGTEGRPTQFPSWDLAQVGWGVIFAWDTPPEVRDALRELIEHRKRQVPPQRFREFAGPAAYRPDEGMWQFLARHGVGPGPPDPDRMPSYLLLVGDPEAIPLHAQAQLDIQYAAGRLHFRTPQEYLAYAHSVVAAETGPPALPKRLVLFGPRYPDVGASALGVDELLLPLADQLRGEGGWQVQVITGPDATRGRLREVLTDAPALLFTLGSGMSFPPGDARQLDLTGSLLGADWPGPLEWGRRPVPTDFCFTPDDLDPSSRLHGRIGFLMHSYSAGSPRFGESTELDADSRAEAIAARPFVSLLSQRLLTHPGGGLLAVIGKFGEVWSSSFMSRRNRQLGAFVNAFRRLMTGQPVGAAMDFFNARYAELATAAATELEARAEGKIPYAMEFGEMLIAMRDARNYIVVGDPAVRLP
jgi:hypothetical protein